jgi:hypothetical protein
MALCNLVGNYQHSGETYCLHLQGGILFQYGIIIIIVVAVVLFIIIWNSYCPTICNLLRTWCLFILVHSLHCNITSLFSACILHCINLQFKAYTISYLSFCSVKTSIIVLLLRASVLVKCFVRVVKGNVFCACSSEVFHVSVLVMYFEQRF